MTGESTVTETKNTSYPYPMECPRGGDNFKITLPSNAGYLIMARAFLEELLNRMEQDEKTTNRLLLVLDEALSNVIRHCYQNDPTKRIDIDFRVTEEGLTISVEDTGTGFLPQQPIPVKTDPTVPGGLGMSLIHKVMDEVRYEIRPEGGTRLLMSKRLSTPASSPSKGESV